VQSAGTLWYNGVMEQKATAKKKPTASAKPVEAPNLHLVKPSDERRTVRRARLADLDALKAQLAVQQLESQRLQKALDTTGTRAAALGAELASLKVPPAVTGFVADVRAAFTWERGLELFIGLLWGGFVPVASFFAIHEALPQLYQAASSSAGWLAWAHFLGVVAVTLGGLLKSSPVVYGAAKEAFGNWAEALGFVLIFEGVMALVPIPWLQAAALVGLVGVNVIGTATRLAQRSRPRR